MTLHLCQSFEINGEVVTLIIYFAQSLPCVQPSAVNFHDGNPHSIHLTVPYLCFSKFISSFLCFVSVIDAIAHRPEGAESYWYTDRKFTIVVTAVLIILPLSIPKEIGFQKYARYKY